MTLIIMAVARAAERLLVTLFGGLSIYWGWRLFMVGITSASDATFQKGNWKVLFKKAGPGIYFAFFGSVLLLSSWWSPLRMTQNNPEYSSAVNAANMPANQRQGSSSQLVFEAPPQGITDIDRKRIRALNTALAVADGEKDDLDIKKARERDLARAKDTLGDLRTSIIMRMYSPQDRANWEKWKNNPAGAPEGARGAVKEINELMTENYAMEGQ